MAVAIAACSQLMRCCRFGMAPQGTVCTESGGLYGIRSIQIAVCLTPGTLNCIPATMVTVAEYHILGREVVSAGCQGASGHSRGSVPEVIGSGQSYLQSVPECLRDL